MKVMKQQSAIEKINKNGVLLVFPVNNKKEPKSLWSEFFPRTKMRWEWDDSGDNRVANMWMLMKRLSDCREVIYSKWYQGRATFFSKDLFCAMLSLMMRPKSLHGELSPAARNILDALEMDSPLSTKELKRVTELQGKFNESMYTRALKELFLRGLVVGFGEVDDGAFPSLAVGATKHLYEELWLKAESLSAKSAQKTVDQFMPEGSLFRKSFAKLFL